MIWKTLCHFSWLNKIDWILHFIIKWPLHAWNDPVEKAQPFSLPRQNLYFVPGRCKGEMSPQAEKHTLSPADDSTCQPCAPLYGNARPLYGSAEVSFQFPIRLLSNGAFSLSPFMWRLAFQAKLVMMSACSSDWICSVTAPCVFVGGVVFVIFTT